MIASLIEGPRIAETVGRSGPTQLALFLTIIGLLCLLAAAVWLVATAITNRSEW